MSSQTATQEKIVGQSSNENEMYKRVLATSEGLNNDAKQQIKRFLTQSFKDPRFAKASQSYKDEFLAAFITQNRTNFYSKNIKKSLNVQKDKKTGNQIVIINGKAKIVTTKQINDIISQKIKGNERIQNVIKETISIYRAQESLDKKIEYIKDSEIKIKKIGIQLEKAKNELREQGERISRMSDTLSNIEDKLYNVKRNTDKDLSDIKRYIREEDRIFNRNQLEEDARRRDFDKAFEESQKEYNRLKADEEREKEQARRQQEQWDKETRDRLEQIRLQKEQWDKENKDREEQNKRQQEQWDKEREFQQKKIDLQVKLNQITKENGEALLKALEDLRLKQAEDAAAARDAAQRQADKLREDLANQAKNLAGKLEKGLKDIEKGVEKLLDGIDDGKEIPPDVLTNYVAQCPEEYEWNDSTGECIRCKGNYGYGAHCFTKTQLREAIKLYNGDMEQIRKVVGIRDDCRGVVGEWCRSAFSF
uniref:Uncharacterized protein n=1 Tax=viral metagenome TaxID=1070528 RepID=A0A6C0ARV6_9ZZZZ